MNIKVPHIKVYRSRRDGKAIWRGREGGEGGGAEKITDRS
jgi:hypothetical protein